MSASLQTRLVAVVMLALTLVGGAAAYKSYDIALHEANELLDAQLAQVGQSLLDIGSNYLLSGKPAAAVVDMPMNSSAMSDDGDDEHREPRRAAVTFADVQAWMLSLLDALGWVEGSEPASDDAGAAIGMGADHPYQRELLFQLWHAQVLVLHSANAPEEPLQVALPSGFSTGEREGRDFRYYRRRRGQLEVVVGQSDKVQHEMATEIAVHNIMPFMCGLPLLGLVTFWLIRLNLRSLRLLAQEVAVRNPSHLEPLSIHDLPGELQPLGQRINQLLGRLGDTLERERRFTADAAHELRTPLAALRAQAESALLGASTAELRHGLRQTLKVATRLEHLVAQLLLLARLENRHWQMHAEFLQLERIAETVCAELGAQALRQGQDLSLRVTGPTRLKGQADLLGALVRNLVDNALKYSPVGARIMVSVQGVDAGVRLEVVDQGPGVTEAELQRLGERFHRLERRGGDGAGLGLSIVKCIAELHGATLNFSLGEAGGLRVELVFHVSHNDAASGLS